MRFTGSPASHFSTAVILLLAGGDQVFDQTADRTAAGRCDVEGLALDFKREVEGYFLRVVLPHRTPTLEEGELWGRLACGLAGGRWLFDPGFSYGVIS